MPIDDLILPSMLDSADKFLPVITRLDDYRYFLLEGGRGGGKSHFVARFILYLAEKYNLRVVCGRETQISISESVYSLFADLVRQFNLKFEVTASKILCPSTGSSITFRGFREQGRFQIQGMEGISLLWIDEAQAIKKDTLDVLIPTIRLDTAKIFFTMNRFIPNDPVYASFVGRKDCLHININYLENPFCTNALKNEADECKARSLEDYDHIWMGNPLEKTEDALFTEKELKDTAFAKYPMRQGYGMKLAGFDVARYGDDKSACVIVTQMGALHWEVSYVDQWGDRDLNYTTGRILMTANEQGVFKSAIDEDGIGAAPLDTLNKGRGLDNFVGFRNPSMSYDRDKFYGNNRTANAYKLKEMVTAGHIVIKDEALIQELSTLRYTFDHNQRRILISKDNMRKDGIKSPNLADALIMAVSLIGNVVEEQTREYVMAMPQYSKEENLYKLGGVR